MAKFEDYAKKYVEKQEGEAVDLDIKDAAAKQQERKDATPEVNWEDRYKELEKLNSRQAQELGNYRKMVDEYITTPTPDKAKESVQPSPEITVEKLYDNPKEVFDEQISTHPAVRRVEELEKKLQERERKDEEAKFLANHPDFQGVIATPEFANWVADNPTRIALAQAADAFDFYSADALFSLYKAEKGLKAASAEVNNEREIQAASLESSAAGEPPKIEEYSRSHMLQMKTRAKQGDIEAENYVRAHGANYLKALSEGNVRP